MQNQLLVLLIKDTSTFIFEKLKEFLQFSDFTDRIAVC